MALRNSPSYVGPNVISDGPTNMFQYVNSDNTACTCNFLSIAGGIVLHAAVLGHEGSLKSLVHEMGHALGLWHVHRGVSEVACGHECFEEQPSMYTGDILYLSPTSSDTIVKLWHFRNLNPVEFKTRRIHTDARLTYFPLFHTQYVNTYTNNYITHVYT